MVDPFQTGKIIRSAFLAWYTTLVEVAGDNDDGDASSLDTADREETCLGRRKGDEYALFGTVATLSTVEEEGEERRKNQSLLSS